MFLYNKSSVSCCRIMSLVPDEVRRCVCVGRVWRHGGEVTGLIGLAPLEWKPLTAKEK